MSEEIVNLIVSLAWVFFGAIPLVICLIITLFIFFDMLDKRDRARVLFRRTLSDEENRIITDYLGLDHKDYDRLKEYGEVESTK